MAKSMRSKFKKKMKKIAADKEKPQVAKRVTNLKVKLDLVANGGISKVPMQPLPTEFYHKNPDVLKGTPLKLAPMKTNVHKGLRGHEGNKSGENLVHPQLRMREHVAAENADLPLSGHSGGMSAPMVPVVNNLEGAADFIDDDAEVVEEAPAAVVAKKVVKLATAAEKNKSGEKKMKAAPAKRLVSGGKKK
jgi:hypothetical protein